MKKVLVALAMVMGLGSSVAFAYVVSGTQSVEQTQQNPQDEFTKVEVKDLPQAVMNVLAKYGAQNETYIEGWEEKI